MTGPRCRWRLPRFFLVLTFASAAAAARGQVSSQTTLVEIVPASSRVFLQIHDLGGLQQVLHRARGFRLAAFISDSAPKGPERTRLETILKNVAGSAHSIPPDDLRRCEIGLVADSLIGLVNPVWLIRAPDENTIRRWFPQQGQPHPETSAANVFRTDDGRFVCIRGRFVAVAPQATDWVQLGNVLRALTGAEPDTLDKQTAYRESMAYLPGKPLATLYLAPSPHVSGVAPDRSLAVGLYAKDETVDVAFRGSPWGSLGKGAVSQAAVDRFLQLPQTTLGAYLTTVDWDALSSQPSLGTPGVLARYVRLIKELSQADSGKDSPFPPLGRHVIAAWGQDFSPRGTTPQFALLVETPDAGRVAQSARRVATSLTRVLSTLELRNVAEELSIDENTHLGIPVYSMPLRVYAPKSRFAWVKALEHLTPSWAANGDWFIVTLTTEHLHQLLDAQIGFLSALGNDRDARTLRDVPQRNASIAFLQGSMASTTLHFWERSLRDLSAAGAMPRLLAGGEAAAQNNKSLGIEIGAEDTPGVVEVTAVAASTPAFGRLLPGDWIVGLDGRLLEMAAPENDLRTWWDKALAGSTHTIRVLRGDEMLELDVTRRPDQAAMADLFSEPINLLRELSRACESIPAATLQIHDAGDRHFSALLRLRLDAVEQ